VSSASLNGVLFYNSRVRIRDITDGTTNTFLAGERLQQRSGHDRRAIGGRPRLGVDQLQLGRRPSGDSSNPINSAAAAIGNDARLNNFGSGHAGGANFVLCDASVRFVSLVDLGGIVTFQRLCVPNDGAQVVVP